MKRLYTLALSALVLTASAAVAVPQMKMAKAKTALTERVENRMEAASHKARHASAPRKAEAEETSVEITAADFTFGDNAISCTKDGFYVALNKENGSNKPAQNKENIRLYAKNTLTISATSVTKVVITLASDAAAQYGKFDPSTGAYTQEQAKGDTELTWNGDTETVVFTVEDKATLSSNDTKACQIRIAKITIYGVPGDGEAPEVPTNEVADIAAFLAAKDTKTQTTITGDVTVTYQNGKYLFVTDASGSMEVYGDVEKTYTNGTVLSNITGTYTEYGKMPQFAPFASSFTEGTQGEAVAPVEYDATTAHLGQYIKLTDVEITENEDNGKFYVEGLQLYDQFKFGEELEIKAAEKATVVGIYGCYNSTMEVFVISIDYDGEPGGDDPINPGEPTDIEGIYTWTATSLLNGGGLSSGSFTLKVTDKETGAATMTFNETLPFNFTLSAVYDEAAGTLSIANNQDLGVDDNGDATYFYIKDVDDEGNLTEGAANVEAAMGTIENGVITFGTFDIWAVGDPKAEDLGWWLLTYRNVLTAEVEDDPNADPNEGWKSIGKANFMDGWVIPAFSVDQAEFIYEVEMQQNEKNENLYRLVDPYHGDSPVADYNTCNKVGYIEFDVTDPEHVVFSTNVTAGFGSVELGLDNIYCYNTLGFYAGYLGVDGATIVDYFGDEIIYTTYKDGVVTLGSVEDAEYGLMYDACFGISGDVLAGYGWTGEDDETANMSAKIWFPGVTPEEGSIKEISADKGGEVYYNLRGQRIAKPSTPGLYILNNQKVLVK